MLIVSCKLTGSKRVSSHIPVDEQLKAFYCSCTAVNFGSVMLRYPERMVDQMSEQRPFLSSDTPL